MVMRELSVIVAATIFAVTVAIGYFSQKHLGPDNLVEEYVEDYIEDFVEDVFNLPEDSMDGYIDFSPDTVKAKENNGDDCPEKKPEDNQE